MKVIFNIARVLAGLIALLFLTMGLQWYFMPINLMSQFAISPEGVLGMATIRADLGGFFLFAAIAGAIGVSNMKSANTFGLCLILLMLLAAFGRGIGFVVEGVPEGGIQPFVFELVTAAIMTTVIKLRDKTGAEA